MKPLSIWYLPYAAPGRDGYAPPRNIETNNLSFPTLHQRAFHPSIGDKTITSAPGVIEDVIEEEHPLIDKFIEILASIERDVLPYSVPPVNATLEVSKEACDNWMKRYFDIEFGIMIPLMDLERKILEYLRNNLEVAGIPGAGSLYMEDLSEEDIARLKRKGMPINLMVCLNSVLHLACSCEGMESDVYCELLIFSPMRLLMQVSIDAWVEEAKRQRSRISRPGKFLFWRCGSIFEEANIYSLVEDSPAYRRRMKEAEDAERIQWENIPLFGRLFSLYHLITGIWGTQKWQ